MLTTSGPVHSAQQPPQPWDSGSSPRFQTLKFLGKGGQGFVQLAYDNLHQQRVAIKYIDRGWSRGFYKYVLRETLNHQQLSLCKHPHIVEFHEVFLTPSYLAVVMEYVNGTNLQHYLEAAGGKLPEDVARFIFQQLVVAVDFCHRKGKVNRDIKLANILLQEGHLPLVKLCDFGFSKDKFDDSEPQTQIGTALFTAPEIFTNVPGQVYDAEAADVWSCGVVLFVMLFGCHPFLSLEDTQHRKHAQVMKLIENAVRGNVQVPAGAEESYPQALDLVRSILVSAPGHRYKLPAIMAHPWFQDKLPPGALLLNAAYLSMENPVGELRQTSEEVHSIITGALSAGVGDPENSESTSAAVGGGVEVNSASDISRAMYSPHPPPLQPQGSVGTGGLPPPPAATPTMAGTMHPTQNPMAVCPGNPGHMAPEWVPGASRTGAASGSGSPMAAYLLPQPPLAASQSQQPGTSQLQGLSYPQHPQHANLFMPHPSLQPMGPPTQIQARSVRHMVSMDGQPQSSPSPHASSSSHPTTNSVSGLSGGMVTVPGQGPGSSHGAAGPNPGLQSLAATPMLHLCMGGDAAMQTAGFQHASPVPLQAPPASPLAMPSDAAATTAAASMALSTDRARSRTSMGGPAASARLATQMDPTEVASRLSGAGTGAGAAGQPGSGGGGGPSAMEVGGCILYDSSLLYNLDLRTEE